MVKQIFIPAAYAEFLQEVDAASGQATLPTDNGDYVAIAGVRATKISRKFTEADPNDANQPLFVSTSEIGIDPDPDADGFTKPGTTYTVEDSAFSIGAAAVRQSVHWFVVDPDDTNDPKTELASSNNETWAPPDTSSTGDRQLGVKVVYKDIYSNRTITIGNFWPLQATNNSPSFATQPALSSPNTALNATITITPGTVTGTPTPTSTYQVYEDGVAVGDPIAGTTFVGAKNSVSYSVRQIATNTAGTRQSSMSNAIKIDDATAPGPVWTQGWAAFSELGTAPEGRVQIVLTNPTYDAAYDYFSMTSEVYDLSVTQIRANGTALAGASQTVIKQKVRGQTIYPRIFAITKGVTTDGAGGLFLLSDFGFGASGYTIQGIVPDTAARSLDVPKPDSVMLAEAKRRYIAGKPGGGAKGVPRVGPQNGGAGCNRPFDKHCIIPIAMAAYYGDTDSVSTVLDILEKWRINRSAVGNDNAAYSGWTGWDPYCEGGYNGNYGLVWAVFMLLALNTPAVKSALPQEGVWAICAYLESQYFIQIYGQSHKVSATTSNNSDSRNTMVGTSFSWTLGSEPNISVGNLMMLVIGHAFLQSPYGQDWLDFRLNKTGGTIAELWTKWSKSEFSDLLDSAPLKRGSVSSGARVCDNLYRMFQMTGGGAGGSTVPTTATMKADWRIGAGPTNWRSSYGHNLANLENIILHGMFRAFGCEPGSATAIDGERGTPGDQGDLLDPNNPNKVTNPPLNYKGARVASWGMRWYRGFACAAPSSIAGRVAGKGTIQGYDNGNPWEGQGIVPDFKRGVPQYGNPVSGGYSVSGGAFVAADRRGYVVNQTYSPCPFEGQAGVVSEMDTVDSGGFKRLSATTYSGGAERCTTSYSAFTLNHIVCIMGALQALQQGPENLLSDALKNMTGGWSSGDAGWSAAAAPGSDWGSTNCYSFAYNPGQTGTSGELITTAFPLRNLSHLFAARLQMASGAGSVTVAVRFLNASNAVVGSDVVVYSGAVDTTLRDKDKTIARPTGATKALFVVTVAKGSTTGVLRVGGTCVRFQPRSLITWDSATVKTCFERARRGIIHWRFCVMNTHRDIAKQCIALGTFPISDSGTRSWANDKDGERSYYLTIAPLINTFIPWWRKNIDGFSAINTGFTGWNWENPVTTASDGGLTAK